MTPAREEVFRACPKPEETSGSGKGRKEPQDPGFFMCPACPTSSELVWAKEVQNRWWCPTGECKPTSMDIRATPHILAWLKAQVHVVNGGVDCAPLRPRRHLDNSSSPSLIQSITRLHSLASEATLESCPYPLIPPPPLLLFKCLEQCLAHNWDSINIWWKNEQKNK